MMIRKNRLSLLTSAALLTLFGGASAIADDTELLLVNPDPSQRPTPNVLFILDTSGSMTSTEETTEPYDSSNSYSGNCDPDRLYWTDVDVTPVCDGSETNYVDKASFHCAFAERQLAGIGSFTNTMVQYRPDQPGMEPSWNELEPGNATAPVECQADSGTHGDGTVGDVYAAAGSGLANPWTSDSMAEISWGSSPRNVAYTVYDGNYLNWQASPVTVTLSRNEIMRTVTTTMLNSLNNLNVGVMRFNNDDGGVVIESIKDLDDNRADIIATVDALNASGATPLAETLYESALYWNGLAAVYGTRDEHTTDPSALASEDPDIYQNPPIDVCAKSYNVLLTDGEPNQDTEAQVLAPTLPDFASLLGRTTCTGTNEGDCLDDIGEYLSKVDTDTTTPGAQGVTTHTIGFNIDLPLLRDTAAASGGQYFLADDVDSLTVALLQIVANINDRSLSFAAPAVAVNTFNRTQNLNQLYLTVFGARPNVHWPGNLKRYEIVDGTIVDSNGSAAVNPTTGFFYDTARSYWTQGADDGNDVRLGGAANQLPDPSVRNLFTNNGDANLSAASNLVTPSNVGAFTNADFGLTGAPGEPSREDIIRWARGEDIRDEDNDPATLVRNAMGDPLHSQPSAVVYGGSADNPDVVVFTATNDGYLHAINGNTGEELWSFIPHDLLSNMTRLFFDPQSRFKNYGIDGDVVPVIRDENQDGVINGSDFVYLIFGLRRGGSSYYALDVTDKNAPELLWKTNFANAGQSWSTPVVTRMNIDDAGLNANKAVVVVADGYDPVHDTAMHPETADGVGAGIRILDLESGAELWRAGRDAGADLQLAEMTRAIPTRVRVLDVSGDGQADRMYASDLGGQIWRFDIANGNTPGNLVSGGVIARLGAEGLGTPTAADTRRFYSTPDISTFTDPMQNQRFIAISIGSGYRAHPFDLSATDRFFSLRDPDVFRQLSQADYDNYNVITPADLVEISGQLQVELDAADRGWQFTLPPNQKVLEDSVTFDNEVFFVGFSPNNDAQSTCSAGQGTNFLYRVSVVNGDPIVNNLDALDPGEADDARRQALAQGGIAPSPAILFPSPEPDCTGAACSPPPIGCVGVECFDPGFVNNPVRTLWTQDGIQ
ncbi:MAG: PilC/PilY family type IV pilus protein [Woeseiaceae bacterium]|nr:PilC/PilY family type IV pilus protein [Woeseiaceae bacterium]